MPSGDGGRDHVDRQPDLRVRHGREREDRHSGKKDDHPGGLPSGRGHHGGVQRPAAGREALRGGPLEQGEHRPDQPRPHPRR